MRRRWIVGATVVATVLLVAAPASAKGPREGTITAAGLAAPISIGGEGGGGPEGGRLVGLTGFFEASFGMEPDPLLASPPSVDLGPALTLTWTVPGPNGVVDEIVQTLYPYANGATLALPGPRDAIADLLGLGGVRITTEDRLPPGLAGTLDLGQPITVDDAQARLGGALSFSSVGAPDGAFAGRPPGAVTVVWAPSPERPEVLDTGVGLLLSVFPGDLDRQLVEKRVAAGTTVEATTVSGREAYWVGGAPHAFLYLDEQQRPREDTIRLSGHSLLWADDGSTYRLELAGSLAQARAVAEALMG